MNIKTQFKWRSLTLKKKIQTVARAGGPDNSAPVSSSGRRGNRQDCVTQPVITLRHSTIICIFKKKMLALLPGSSNIPTTYSSICPYLRSSNIMLQTLGNLKYHIDAAVEKIFIKNKFLYNQCCTLK